MIPLRPRQTQSLTESELRQVVWPTDGSLNFASESYAENLAQDAINGSQAYVDRVIEQHLVANTPHSQYLTKAEAADIYALPVTVDGAISRHVEDFHPVYSPTNIVFESGWGNHGSSGEWSPCRFLKTDSGGFPFRVM